MNSRAQARSSMPSVRSESAAAVSRQRIGRRGFAAGGAPGGQGPGRGAGGRVPPNGVPGERARASVGPPGAFARPGFAFERELAGHHLAVGFLEQYFDLVLRLFELLLALLGERDAGKRISVGP